MTTPNRYWFLLNWQAWAVLIMGAIATIITRNGWLITLGIIGYLLAILFDIIGGGSLGRTGYVRLARAEQENRTLRAEQARLLGGLKEMQDKLAGLETQTTKPPEPASPEKPPSSTAPA
jgi:hypothetical protein